MTHTRSGEYGQLLSSDKSDQHVNGRNTRTDIVLGIHAGHGIYGKSVDTASLFRVYLTHSVYRSARTVEYSAQYLRRQRKLYGMTEESCFRVIKRDPRSSFKHLNYGTLLVHLNNSSLTNCTRISADLYHFLILYARNMSEYQKRSRYFRSTFVIYNHNMFLYIMELYWDSVPNPAAETF